MVIHSHKQTNKQFSKYSGFILHLTDHLHLQPAPLYHIFDQLETLHNSVSCSLGHLHMDVGMTLQGRLV